MTATLIFYFSPVLGTTLRIYTSWVTRTWVMKMHTFCWFFLFYFLLIWWLMCMEDSEKHLNIRAIKHVYNHLVLRPSSGQMARGARGKMFQGGKRAAWGKGGWRNWVRKRVDCWIQCPMLGWKVPKRHCRLEEIHFWICTLSFKKTQAVAAGPIECTNSHLGLLSFWMLGCLGGGLVESWSKALSTIVIYIKCASATENIRTGNDKLGKIYLLSMILFKTL